MKKIKKDLQTLKEKGLFKNIKTVTSGQGTTITVDGVEYLNMCSNNYLGLASDEKVKAATIEAVRAYGVGTTSVRALIGTHTLHIELEKKLAEFKKTEAAVVLTGGYIANLAAVQTIIGKEDIVISDELNHASIIDAVKLSGVEHKFIYRHADMDDLRSLLEKVSALKDEPTSTGEDRRVLIITDGVFSMDGDIAPLPEIVEIAREMGAMVMVDDAHGEGVLGDHGRGIVDHFNLHGKVDIEVGTLSKAFGVMGGFITGSHELIELYKQKGRQFLFTNALSIPDTAALIAAVDLMSESDERVKNLWKNARLLKKELQEKGYNTGLSETPIVPVMIGNEEKAQECARMLLDMKIMATPITFPMVAMGTARLRLQPSALHTEKDILSVVEALEKINSKLAFK